MTIRRTGTLCAPPAAENPQKNFDVPINKPINNFILTKEHLTCYKISLAGVKYLMRGEGYEISGICE
jgi:hypothetical protein